MNSADFPEIVRAILVGIAAWRLASFFVYEDGPWFIFRRIRSLVGIKVENGITIIPETGMATWLSCVWCFSVATCALMWLCYDAARPVVLLFDSMAVAVLFNEIVRLWR